MRIGWLGKADADSCADAPAVAARNANAAAASKVFRHPIMDDPLLLRGGACLWCSFYVHKGIVTATFIAVKHD